MSDWDPTAPPPPPPPPSAPPPPPPPGAPAPTEGGRLRPLPLRQMGVGEILDSAIKLYRLQWAALMSLVGLVIIPWTFLQAWLLQTVSPSAFDPSFFAVTGQVPPGFAGAVILVVGLGLVSFLFVQPFLTAAVARAAATIYLGEDLELGPTYRFALRRVHSILWISILTVLALIGVFLPGVLAIFAAAATGDGVGLAVLLFFLLLFPAAFVWVRLVFGSTILVVEGLKGTKALGRSWRLVKGQFWRIVGTLLVAGILSLVVAALLAAPADYLAARLGAGGWAVSTLGQALATVVTTPFATLMIVLLYFDVRIRKEAFDLDVMAQELATGR